MKTKILRPLVICFLVAITSNSAFAQVSAIGDFSNANMTSLGQVICSGKSVDLSIPSPDLGNTYEWQTRFHSADGATEESATSFAIASNTGTYSDIASNLTTPGYYVYKLKVTNTTTQCSEIYDQWVYILPTPIVTITAPLDVMACQSATEDITFTASGASTPSVPETFAITYQWYSQKQGGGTETLITGETSNSYTVATPTGSTAIGIYDYFVKVKYVIKDCGETLSDKKTVEVQASPTKPTITIASN